MWELSFHVGSWLERVWEDRRASLAPVGGMAPTTVGHTKQFRKQCVKAIDPMGLPVLAPTVPSSPTQVDCHVL
jgi:hypothetical protein